MSTLPLWFPIARWSLLGLHPSAVTCPSGVEAVGQFWNVVSDGVWYCESETEQGRQQVSKVVARYRKRQEGWGRRRRTSLRQSFLSFDAAARICPSGLNLMVERGVVMLVNVLRRDGGWKVVEEVALEEYSPSEEEEEEVE